MVDFDGILSSDSKVCKQCYDFHRRVLHLHNSPQSTPVLALDDIVAQLEGKVEQLEGNKNELISDKEYLEWVVCKVTLKLVKTLQQDEAMLLPELHSHFYDVVSKTIQNVPNVQKSPKTSLPTNRWLLSSISNYLQDNLGIVCKHKRYGTLLYRKNGDLLKAHSKALGNAHKHCKIPAYSRQECSSVFSVDLGECKPTEITQHNILQACTVLNTSINKKIKSLVKTYQNNPLLCESFDPDVIFQ